MSIGLTVSLLESVYMQTLTLCISLPDDAHSEMEVRLSTNDFDGEVVISLPACRRLELAMPALVSVAPLRAVNDDYELGGYAGI